jgi:opacity protein-like surface antigen
VAASSSAATPIPSSARTCAVIAERRSDAAPPDLDVAWRRLELELELERHPHFFKDQDVAGLVPAQGIDLDTDATMVFANAVVPYRLEGRAGIWCPYLVAGLGVIRAEFESTGLRSGAGQDTTTRQDDLSFAIGGGVMHALTQLVGLRVDLRYLHALVDESSGKGGYFKDYGFWRVSVGFTIGFPGH